MGLAGFCGSLIRSSRFGVDEYELSEKRARLNMPLDRCAVCGIQNVCLAGDTSTREKRDLDLPMRQNCDVRVSHGPHLRRVAFFEVQENVSTRMLPHLLANVRQYLILASIKRPCPTTFARLIRLRTSPHSKQTQRKVSGHESQAPFILEHFSSTKKSGDIWCN